MWNTVRVLTQTDRSQSVFFVWLQKSQQADFGCSLKNHFFEGNQMEFIWFFLAVFQGQPEKKNTLWLRSV